MSNSRNKKLLASFLTALGLTTNSANINVSASFKQFGSDLRFTCKILGGAKAEERNKLDELADDINKFLDDANKGKRYFYVYFDICNRLFETLESIKGFRSRNKYTSILFNNFEFGQEKNVISECPFRKEENKSYDFAKTQEWVNKISQIRGGKCTVWGSKIIEALGRLSKLEKLDTFEWTANNGIKCSLDNKGHLVIMPNSNSVVKDLFNDINDKNKEWSIEQFIISVSFDNGENCDTIGTEAFKECKNLTNIKIPESIKYIGGNAFFDCTSLTSINIPESIKYIDACAFFNCKSLTSIRLPESIEFVEATAFMNCNDLTVHMSENNKQTLYYCEIKYY